MIVKDEEAVLKDCLDSIIDWVDEIILVDTGSSDETVKIAESYGEKVKIYHQEWTKDFSFHRNYAMSLATMEWVLTIDADERVVEPDGQALKSMLRDTEGNIIGVDVRNLHGDIVHGQFLSLRLFRRSYEPEYQGRIHNKPVIRNGEKVLRIGFRINHIGYDLDADAMLKKYNRRVEMSELETEDNPESPEAWYDYARSMKSKTGREFNKREFVPIASALERCIAICEAKRQFNHIYIQALGLQAIAYWTMGINNDAIFSCKKALVYKTDYLDSFFMLGQIYTYGVDALEGEIWLKKYLEEQAKYPFSKLLDKISLEFGHERIMVYRSLIEVEKWKLNLNNKISGVEDNEGRKSGNEERAA